ncbi:Maf-like protein [Clostridium thailandense]|uniref:dTTP/UTP pyrophosphatase n=1 Tax=Clostridium thailandense TaxID=2794346 RepID=A0A949X3X4_9CLOT|nr:Maf-like protein [Clostridium thailandense]MBV7273078.1 Maf-like protein [Clostridium thailandense]MCH5135742.1 Maf-like protein [Clostridiaceae bacterium UIB06]
MKVILASASARRQELLKRLTNEFEIIVSKFDEGKIAFDGNCGSYVMKLAEGKALDVYKDIKNESVIIGCDTIVSFQDRILGKPKDEMEAFNMLRILSGNCHQVYSGIALVNSLSGKIIRDYVCTDVKFDKLSNDTIKKYIEKGEYKDKAGAYGIQGYGGTFVEEIHGCYYNVVGLPLNKLSKMMVEMGVNS